MAATPLPDRGRLEEHPLPHLLLGLWQQRFSGALRLSRGRTEKRVLFREGLPVFAESNLASESLGVQMMDRGQLSRPDYNRMTAHIDRTHCKEGTALLELDLLKPKELFLALKDQLRRRILECFSWPHGEFELDRVEQPAEECQPFRTDVYPLLQEGIEAHWASERVLVDLSDVMEKHPHPNRNLATVAAQLKNDEGVEAMLRACNGSCSLWEAVQRANTPRALATIWVLHTAGVFRYTDAPAESAEGPDATEIELVVVAGAAGKGTRNRASRSPAVSRSADAAARDTQALTQRIRTLHARLGEADAYELLGLDRGADAAAVKRAYHAAAKTFHPDALGRMDLESEDRQKVGTLFGAIGKAYEMLSDPKRRREYDASLSSPSADIDANRLAQAETLYRKAEVLMRQGNFRGALEFLAPAVELWPDECAYQDALGWALFKKVPSEPEAAREHLEAAIRIDPDDGGALFHLSVVLRALGDHRAAEDAAARAHALDPSL